MGVLLYQIWKMSDKKDRNLMLGFLSLDVLIWNIAVVPIAASQGIILPQLGIEHLQSIIDYFAGPQ